MTVLLTLVTSPGDLDHSVIAAAARHRHEWANHVADTTMYVGTTPSVLIAVCLACAVVVVLLHAYRLALVAGASVLLAGLAANLLKSVFERPRPPGDLALVLTNGYSFPSTQAAETSAIAVSVLVLLLVGPGWGSRLTEVFPRRAQLVVAVALVVAVLFVGVCMVYMGAHWPTDVVAGWLLGTTIGLAVGLVGSRVAVSARPT